MRPPNSRDCVDWIVYLALILLALGLALGTWRNIARAEDIAAILPWTVELSRRTNQDWPITRGETVTFAPAFLQNGDAKDLSEATAVLLRYRTSSCTNYLVCTGYVHSATGGLVRVRWDATAAATNSTYLYNVVVQSGSSTLCRATGKLKLSDGVAIAGGAATNPTMLTHIDWATTGQDNPDSSGYYRIGETNLATKVWIIAQGYTTNALGVGTTNLTYYYTKILADARYLQAETDPIFAAAAAAGITVTHTQHWHTAYDWGDHSGAGYLTAETDPSFPASPAAGDLLRYDGTNWTRLTNSYVLTAGTLSGTNGWFIDDSDGTNYWLLKP